MCGITMETRSNMSHHTIPDTHLRLHVRLYVGKYVLMNLTSDYSVSHLVGGVDSGTCLEEYPHHTEMTLLGCHHQRSKAILWSSEGGGGAKVVCGFTREMHASIVSRLIVLRLK